MVGGEGKAIAVLAERAEREEGVGGGRLGRGRLMKVSVMDPWLEYRGRGQ